MTYFSRRSLLQTGAAMTGGLSVLPTRTFGNLATEPHFYLQFYYSGGFDSSYLFDARPLSHTAAGKIQNYLGEEATRWTGTNEMSCLATSLVQPLLPFKDYFSILNGVMSAPRDDGHDQNTRALFTGNAFGGDSYLPYLNEVLAPRASLDFVGSGFLFVPFTNANSSVTLSPDGFSSFTKIARQNTEIGSDDPSIIYLRKRLENRMNGSGRFSASVRNMLGGLGDSFSLRDKFKNIELNFEEKESKLSKSLKAAHKMFVSGITNCFVISDFFDRNPDIDLDTHDGESAARQPKTYAAVVAEIAETFAFLKNTVFDEAKGLSLLDVTTVVISSEFNRTNYQVGNSMDKTGTDHNPLSNLMILGGRGIKGGQVIGATDLDSLDANGNYQNVSPVHLELDSVLIKRMGKPFDFDSMRPSNVLPENFDMDDYLTIGSVVNSLLKMYGCDESRYWANTRNGKKARILSGLLA